MFCVAESSHVQLNLLLMNYLCLLVILPTFLISRLLSNLSFAIFNHTAANKFALDANVVDVKLFRIAVSFAQLTITCNKSATDSSQYLVNAGSL